jgi:SOS-response transcriptional repressor LexA
MCYTREGWLYLATVVDSFSRKVVGWAVSERMTKQLVINAMGQSHLAVSLTEKQIVARQLQALSHFPYILLTPQPPNDLNHSLQVLISHLGVAGQASPSTEDIPRNAPFL